MSADPSVPETEQRWLQVLSTLNEWQARLFVAQRALAVGRGGISQVSQLTGMSRPAIYRGIAELRSPGKWKAGVERNRIRRGGGGRKPLVVTDPQIPRLLEGILEETTAGDPMSLLKWTGKSTRTMAAELTRQVS